MLEEGATTRWLITAGYWKFSLKMIINAGSAEKRQHLKPLPAFMLLQGSFGVKYSCCFLPLTSATNFPSEDKLHKVRNAEQHDTTVR